MTTEPITRCGGCREPVDPTTERCGRCGFPDGAAMKGRGWLPPRSSVYVVEVFERDDGVYVFGDWADAARFEKAVNRAAGYRTDEDMTVGSACFRSEQTVCDTETANALIDGELAR
jgi:hypothetical protein